MKKTSQLVKTAIACFATFTVTSTLADTATTTEQMEKCYGVVKAGMNDCQTKTSSCAGSATKDKQSDAFILLPKGTCQKLVGGNLTDTSEKK